MTPLVFLPGMMCDARLFAPQIAQMSAQFPIVHCPIGGHDTVEGLARDVLSIAPPQFALCGLSMGGVVAMEVLRQAPSRVMKLALLDTNPLAEVEAVKAMRGPQIEAVKAGNLTQVMQQDMIPKYLFDKDNNKSIEELCLQMALDAGPDVFVKQSYALMGRADQTQTLSHYKGPSLVLTGRDDQLCPMSRHDLMHSLLEHSSLEIIENAGHLPLLEQPQATTNALKKWMET